MMLRYYVKTTGQYAGAASVAHGQDPAAAFNPLRDAGYIEVPEAAPSGEWFWDFANLSWHLPASASAERSWRDSELAEWIWLRDRHRDQLDLEVAPSLEPHQFTELLIYLQQLRDWPQTGEFPEMSERPKAPDFLEQLRSGYEPQ